MSRKKIVIYKDFTQKGFTLFELAIVLLIIGITITAGYNAITPLRRGMKQQQIVQRLDAEQVKILNFISDYKRLPENNDLSYAYIGLNANNTKKYKKTLTNNDHVEYSPVKDIEKLIGQPAFCSIDTLADLAHNKIDGEIRAFYLEYYQDSVLKYKTVVSFDEVLQNIDCSQFSAAFDAANISIAEYVQGDNYTATFNIRGLSRNKGMKYCIKIDNATVAGAFTESSVKTTCNTDIQYTPLNENVITITVAGTKVTWKQPPYPLTLYLKKNDVIVEKKYALRERLPIGR